MLLKFGEVPVMVASSREAAKEILKTHDALLATRPQTTTFKILSKRGLGIALAPYGDHWRQLRKICNMALLSANHVRSFRAIREEEVARLVESIMSASASAAPLVNLSKMIAGYVADAALRAIMGNRLKARARDAFIDQLAEGVRLAAGFSLADLYPSSRLARLLSRSSRKMEIHREAMLELMDIVVGEHMQRDGGLQIPLTMDTVKGVIIDLFAGSNDTSATTLEWAMAELMRNPTVMSKLQDEVRGAFAATMKVSEGGLDELSYLHMVIKETLRLHLPAPLLLPRESQEQCQILGYDANVELALANLAFYFDWSLPEGLSCSELDMTETAGVTVRKKTDLWVRATPSSLLPR
ncbi:hypothetical protein HU200_060025 [Digitaria exilis]|uniref:Cytochrome P450 n=1 Tax=Digitaria exilis TaxID=1010633 RepID=A0A835A733_9POAL|nr:hypothetical protein HU200_060025 [Digitaria exilis]